MTTETNNERNPLYMAAINCPHSIDHDRVALYFDTKQPGNNALNQLANRLEAALATQQSAAPIVDAPQQAVGVPESVAARLSEIREQLHTQDNRITAAPMFAVQERKRVYGIDTDYDPKIVWIGEEGHEADAEEAGKLEAGYGDDGATHRGGYRRVGYHEYWEFVTACFTEQGCKDYLARNGHNLGETRIYAYGTYRNEEWKFLRELLMAAPHPVSASTVDAASGDGVTKDAVTREQIESWAKMAGITHFTEAGISRLGDFAIFARMAKHATASDAPAVVQPSEAGRVPLALTHEQVSALYVHLVHRNRPDFGWIEAPLVAIEEALKPAHNAVHDRQFNAMNRQFFGDDRLKLGEAGMPSEVTPLASLTEDERIGLANDQELDEIGAHWHMEREPGETSAAYRDRIRARKTEFKEWLKKKYAGGNSDANK